MKKLIVLDKAIKLNTLVYTLMKKYPEEKFILIPQILRSSISVASNIAEGSQRTDKEFYNFLRITRGSLYELETQLIILKDVYKTNYEEIKIIFGIIDEIGAMTYKLMLRLKSDD